MKLRPYQVLLVECARIHMKRGAKSILITSPTGSGKTILTAYMLNEAASKGKRSLFLVHRRELITQALAAFQTAGMAPGVIASGFTPDPSALVQIASVQTLARRDVPPAELVVWDESHHIAARTWSALRARYPDAYHIGLTATPERTDGRGLGDHFETLLQGPQVSRLIADGFLSPFRYYAPGGIDTAGIRRRAGDFEREALAAAADRPTITGSALDHYQRLCPGARAIVFCVSRQHAENVAAQFQANGIPAVNVDGNTPTEERDEAVSRFKEGKIKVLVNVDLFGEGFDVPAVEAAIILRPTQSRGLFLQMCGRALRPSAGKPDAFILDHAGNVERHGLPSENRSWSLESRSRRGNQADGAGASVRICPACFAALPAGQGACNYCGRDIPAKIRKVKMTAGELKEIKEAERRQARREQGQAQSIGELIDLGKERGYSNPTAWAYRVYNARRHG